MRCCALLFFIALAVPVDALAQESHVLFLPGIQYGGPAGASGSLSVFVPTQESGGFRSQGFIAGGAAGQNGAKASVGLARIVEYLEVDVRGVVHRTWRNPRGASAGATYAGVEGGLMIAYVFVNAGVAHRVAGPDGEHASMFSWSAGMQFPIGGWRK